MSQRLLFLRAIARLHGRFGLIIRLALAFELLRFLVLTPLSAGVLRLFLERWGRYSVGNFEIAAFLLSPAGLAGLLALGTVALTTFYLEIAGMLLLLADRGVTIRDIFAALALRLVRLLTLGLGQFILLAAMAAPFAAAAAGVLWLLWRDYDLNGLIVLKPPVFWVGTALAACLALGYAAIAGHFVLRWFLALPAIVFEPGMAAGRAMRLSRQRTEGKLPLMLGLVLVWLAGNLLLYGLLMGALGAGSDWLLDRMGLSLTVLLPATAMVLIVHTIAAAMLSAISMASLASLTLVFYEACAGRPSPAQSHVPAAQHLRPRLPARWLIGGSAALLAGAVGLVSYGLVARVQLHENLEITAHRAGAMLAPENTVAAIRKAIEARADWAEIDVQRTADGAVVVLHDSDLMRVAGERRRVSESTLAEIKAIDVGSHFGAEFKGERVPTLDEALAAAGDRIRFNIELKPGSAADVEPLVRAVLNSTDRAGITGRCRLCSQSYESLQLARQLKPGLQVGFIAGARLGDLSKLDVAFLMVSQRLATRKLVNSGRVRGIEVHTWTVNNPDALLPLVDRGVANIITDDPAAMRRRLDDIQGQEAAERLLLRVRNFLAD